MNTHRANSRARYLTLSFVLFYALASCTSGRPDEPLVRPNFLLIQADDLGYDDIALHGGRMVETPNLDRLGRSSVRFQNFYVSALCAPTRAALLTGRNFLRTGISGVHAGRDYVHLDETMIQEVMRNAGYDTAMWGKWHSGKTDGYMPWDRGFETAYYPTLYNYFDNYGLLNGKTVQTNGFANDAITDMALSYLRSRSGNAPFFAYVSYMVPHNPWRAPSNVIDKYKARGYSHAAASLYSMIDVLDKNIGRLLDELENLDLDENTVVLFLSDNGPWTTSYRFGLNESEWEARNPSGLRGWKATNWENGIRSPLYVRWPGQFVPRVSEDLSRVEDLFPTILDVAGIHYDTERLDGASLKPVLSGECERREEETVFIAYPNPVVETTDSLPEGYKSEFAILTPDRLARIRLEQQRIAIRQGDYKLILNEDDNIGLYNLDLDPRETNNLYDVLPELADDLLDKLLVWRQSMSNESHAFSMPEFQIGFDERTETIIYASSPVEHSAQLVNEGHMIFNWQTSDSWSEYEINVHTPGVYDVYLLSRMTDFSGRIFRATSGEHSISGPLLDQPTRPVPTILRNESAYWEDFDHYDTFYSNIQNLRLGSLRLEEGKGRLRVEQVDVSGETRTRPEDQVIAIHLIRHAD